MVSNNRDTCIIIVEYSKAEAFHFVVLTVVDTERFLG